MSSLSTCTLYLKRRRHSSLPGKVGESPGAEYTAWSKKNVTPHVLRHTLATNIIACGASVVEVKDQLGHRNLETTLKYVHLQFDQRRKMYQEHCPGFKI